MLYQCCFTLFYNLCNVVSKFIWCLTIFRFCCFVLFCFLVLFVFKTGLLCIISGCPGIHSDHLLAAASQVLGWKACRVVLLKCSFVWACLYHMHVVPRRPEESIESPGTDWSYTGGREPPYKCWESELPSYAGTIPLNCLPATPSRILSWVLAYWLFFLQRTTMVRWWDLSPVVIHKP